MFVKNHSISYWQCHSHDDMFRILDTHIYSFMTFTWLDVQFSLPLPQGGRDAATKNPILREDQLPQRVLYPKTKKKTSKQVVCIFVYLTTYISNW